MRINFSILSLFDKEVIRKKMFEPSGILKVCDIYLGDVCGINGYEISLNEVKFI